MSIPKPVWIVLLFFAAVYLIWGGPTASETFRYKLTINVTVDGTPYSASSVIEATQRRSGCLPILYRMGAGGGACFPKFGARGVAPMIHLPDGAVVFASLSGRVDRTNNTGGQAASRLPWLIYVDEWWAGLDRSDYVNLPVVQLPDNPPRIEIPFEGHPLSEMRPPMFFVPHQALGPAMGRYLKADSPVNTAGRRDKSSSFAIEPTAEAVVDCLANPPSWVAAYRGGPKLPKEVTERRRFDRNRPADRRWAVPRFETCNEN